MDDSLDPATPAGDELDTAQTPRFIERIIPPRALALRLFVDFNPFYILSAICMLFGVFALNDSFTWDPIPQRNLLRVLLTINVYEGALIGLALVLLRRHVRRDAMVLMLIETFFLADVGFLNIELFGLAGLKLALAVNALLLLAAAVKALVLLRAARVSVAGGRVAFVLLQLALLFALPGVIAVAGRRHDTFVHPLLLYAGWWMTGLLPVVYAWIAATPRVARLATEDARAVGSRLRTNALTAEHALILSRMLLALPLLSIIAHLSLCHWVYKSSFCAADVAPLLIGAAFAIGRSQVRAMSEGARMRVQLALPVIAVVLSAVGVPQSMIFPAAGNVALSPLRLTLFAAALVYLDLFWRSRHLLLALAALACGGGVVLGYSVGGIGRNLLALVVRLAEALDRVVPRTLHDWGVVSIGTAFVLLGVGALVSFSRRVVAIHEEEGTVR